MGPIVPFENKNTVRFFYYAVFATGLVAFELAAGAITHRMSPWCTIQSIIADATVWLPNASHHRSKDRSLFRIRDACS